MSTAGVNAPIVVAFRLAGMESLHLRRGDQRLFLLARLFADLADLLVLLRDGKRSVGTDRLHLGAGTLRDGSTLVHGGL